MTQIKEGGARVPPFLVTVSRDQTVIRTNPKNWNQKWVYTMGEAFTCLRMGLDPRSQWLVQGLRGTLNPMCEMFSSLDQAVAAIETHMAKILAERAENERHQQKHG
jgi:hypothetical protein